MVKIKNTFSYYKIQLKQPPQLLFSQHFLGSYLETYEWQRCLRHSSKLHLFNIWIDDTDAASSRAGSFTRAQALVDYVHMWPTSTLDLPHTLLSRTPTTTHPHYTPLTSFYKF